MSLQIHARHEAPEGCDASGKVARVSIWILLSLIVLRAGIEVSLDKGMGWDFVTFYDAGRRLWYGELDNISNVEAPIAGQEALSGPKAAFVGLPLAAYAFWSLGAFEPRAALAVFKIQCALLYAASGLLLFAALRQGVGRRMPRESLTSVFLLVVLLFEPLWFTFSVGGQSTPFSLLFLVLFFLFYSREGPSWKAALALCIAISMKPILALMGVVFLLAREWDFLFRLGVVGLLQLCVSLVAFGLQVHLEWVEHVLEAATRLAEPWWNNSSIVGALYSFRYGLQSPDPLAPLEPASQTFRQALMIYKLPIVLFFFWCTRRLRYSCASDLAYRQYLAALAVAFSLFSANVVWPHYLVFLSIPLVVAFSNSESLPLRGLVLLWMVVVSVISVQSRTLQWFALRLFDEVPWVQAVLAALFGGCTLILFLVFLVRYYEDLLPVRKVVSG